MAICSGLLTLLTDFGLDDAYVGVLKGVILGINPRACCLDLCHQVPPQDVRHAAFLLGTAHAYFPRGTVHLVVVDPGVGGPRRPVALATGEAFFVAPDNGVLSYVLAQEQPAAMEYSTFADQTVSVSLGPGLAAVHLTESRWWRPDVSATFHGRDIFAPVAAHLASGVPLHELGTPIDKLAAFRIPYPQLQPDGSLLGTVIHIDRFGNLITDFTAGDLRGSVASIQVGGHSMRGLSLSYVEGDDLLALLGSSGYLEIAVRNGNAAARLQVRVGDAVRISLTRPSAGMV